MNWLNKCIWFNKQLVLNTSYRLLYMYIFKTIVFLIVLTVDNKYFNQMGEKYKMQLKSCDLTRP